MLIDGALRTRPLQWRADEHGAVDRRRDDDGFSSDGSSPACWSVS
jgi:hypothetical protein